MQGHGTKFGRKKEQAIAALLTQRNMEDAAKVADVSLTTLKRWTELPEFKAAYLQARRAIVFQTNARMQQNCSAAASVLLKLMADPATPPSVRGRMAQCILENANKSIEVEEMELRVAALERADHRRSISEGGGQL